MSGPPRDWDALLMACTLWVIAVVGFALGAAAFLSASRNADQAKALADRTNQLSAVVDGKSDVAARVDELSEKLKQAQRSGSMAPPDQSARQAQLEQAVKSLETKLDQVTADLNAAKQESALSSTRLDKLDDGLQKMDLRMTRAEASGATNAKPLAQSPPAPTPAPSVEAAAPASPPADDDKASTYALARYSIVSVVKHEIKLSGPDGIVVVGKGDTLPGGQKILKVTKVHGVLRVVTDHGVIGPKVKEQPRKGDARPERPARHGDEPAD